MTRDLHEAVIINKKAIIENSELKWISRNLKMFYKS